MSSNEMSWAGSPRDEGSDVVGFVVKDPAGRTVGRVVASDPWSVFVSETRRGIRRHPGTPDALSWSYVAWVDSTEKAVLLIDEGAAVLLGVDPMGDRQGRAAA